MAGQSDIIDSPRNSEHMMEPNRLQRVRSLCAEYFAEAFGAGMIVLIGAGAQCQTQLYGAGDTLSDAFAWAIGVAVGAYIAGPISGGMINPAVTIAMVVFRRYPLIKAPGIILAQIVGCWCATMAVYLNYTQKIGQFEVNGVRSFYGNTATAGNFISTPKPNLSLATTFYDEFLGTAILVGCVFAFTNPALPGTALPLAVLFAFIGIGVSVGQTGYAVNPARDFGPRVALTMLGYPAKTLWSHNKGYWFHSIWVADILGGLTGAFLVDLFLYTGPDSIFNRPRTNSRPVRV